MSRLKLIEATVFLAIAVVIAPLSNAQTTSFGGGGTYTYFSSSWLVPTPTSISFTFAFPPEVAPCNGCDYGSYREASYAPSSSTGLNPVLDAYFNNHLSVIHSGLSTSLINSLMPATNIFLAASRTSESTPYVEDSAIYAWRNRDNPTTVLSDGEFEYKATWQSYIHTGVALYQVSDSNGYVATSFDSNTLVSWFGDNPVFMDDWIQIVKVPMGGEGGDVTSYLIEASGWGNSSSNFIEVAGVGNVALIPEPEIYAMLGLGLGLMGWVGRRRKQQVA